MNSGQVSKGEVFVILKHMEIHVHHTKIYLLVSTEYYMEISGRWRYGMTGAGVPSFTKPLFLSVL